ncbi:hypothetical protein [Streptomyces sp. MP131-18]|uniref:hypothetical protein n=1 Tax=Streptomyces sp. MP131-18 TaxID=1857892 RepID=UPI0009C65649|nr:hypothetical protein [Streptomyces sp. MP131-18]ONK13621.1 hypothetical protein STBA_43910 [Streptomyces sp. MP131-18]
MSKATRRAGTAAVIASLVVLTAACGGGDGESPFEGGGSAGGETGGGGDEGGDGGDSGEGGDSGGGSATADLPPDEIAQAAADALTSVDSLRMATVGDTSAIGFGMDLHLDTDGTCQGSVTAPGAGSVELLMSGEEVWMKPDSQFWENGMGASDPALISLVDGSYLHGTTSDPELSQMAGTCALDEFFGELGPTGSAGDNVTADPQTEHNGVPVIPIHEESGGEVTTIFVAAEGEPYPLLMRTQADGTPMEIEFSDFNEPVAFEEPPADQILEIADFRQGDIAA